jgi:Adaptive response protein AidB N-terminal domain
MHERVTLFPNQPPPYADCDLFADDIALQAGLVREGGGAAHAAVAAWGAKLGCASMFELADACNRNPPELHAFDPRGERIDTVTFHPAWHALMDLAAHAGEHCALPRHALRQRQPVRPYSVRCDRAQTHRNWSIERIRFKIQRVGASVGVSELDDHASLRRALPA